MKKIAINGLGRIGRLVLRHYLTFPSKNIDIVAVNDITPVDDLAYLLNFDSVHRRPPFKVSSSPGYLEIGEKKIKVFNERDPLKLPWKQESIDIVLECTGLFTKRDDAVKHLKAGVKKVIISAPSETADITIVQGVNHQMYDPKKHHIISNASCTTNALATAIKVLDDTFGIHHLLVTTVHAYTASQALVDRSSKRWRRGRAAAISLVPSTTGAAKATSLVLPHLKGKMDALAIRAPIPDGAIVDLVAEVKVDVTTEMVNEAYKKAAQEEMKNILAYSEDELVSSDIIGDTSSGIVDATLTRVVDKHMVKVGVWYDNEAGYAKKLLELAEYISKL
jgi:glyceraldehyde 3-phosphate dehydrogenase/glyceraldehyde-3-phosphate dehydrogenase (NAD(P))